MSRTNSTYQASPQNFFPFSYEETIGESAPDDFLYVKDNHLGSVLTVVSDRKLGVDNNSDNIVDYYLPDVQSTTDYYAFGSPMPGRQFNSPNYRYGYQGSEKDDEITGNSGTNYTTHFRGYDARLGRWWSVDPEADEQPYQSPYCAMDNNPILNTDVKGDCTTCDFLAGVAEGVVSGAVGFASAIGSTILHPDVAAKNIEYALEHPGETLDKINQSMGEQGAILYQTGTPQERGKVVGGVVFTAVSTVLGGGATNATKATSTLVKVEKAVVKVESAPVVAAKTTEQVSIKLSKVQKSTTTEPVGKKFTKTTEVKPGRDPGQSRAEYVKYKNEQGTTIKMHKDSYDRSNKFQHRKLKPVEKPASKQKSTDGQ